jgi:acyl-CoA reductase-like NAD-dependent aldehyde dehydrogenase
MATDTLATPATLSDAKTRVFKNFIDGEWVESSTGETFENRNPADTRDLVGIFQKSAKADVNAAVEAAKRAFAKWRLVPAPRRAEVVFRAAEILIERKEDYARDMTREMGKVLAETRGDVQEAIDAAYYNAGEGRRLFGPTVPSEMPNKFAMAVRQPIGVCGMITPWNFPMAISSWKLLPAIVCGNTCVIKPAQDTPLSTFNLVRALYDAGLPKGVINIVTGYGPEVGTPLAEHPDVRAISLTGSSAVGRIVGGIAAQSFKHCSLELGGKNPMIVLDDANLDLAIEGGLWGAFGTTGQRCTATSRMIVQKGIYREAEGWQRTRRVRADGSGHQREATGDRPEVCRDRQERRRKAGVRRQPARQGRLPARMVHGADGIHGCRCQDADRAGRDLWAGSVDYSVRRSRGCHRDCQWH